MTKLSKYFCTQLSQVSWYPAEQATPQVCSLLHQRYADFGAELNCNLKQLFASGAKGAGGAAFLCAILCSGVRSKKLC